jgi:hypothetical protein
MPTPYPQFISMEAAHARISGGQFSMSESAAKWSSMPADIKGGFFWDKPKPTFYTSNSSAAPAFKAQVANNPAKLFYTSGDLGREQAEKREKMAKHQMARMQEEARKKAAENRFRGMPARPPAPARPAASSMQAFIDKGNTSGLSDKRLDFECKKLEKRRNPFGIL